MERVRAKFTVSEIKRNLWNIRDPETRQYGMKEVQTVVLNPVKEGTEEDNHFWAATPGGRIELGCVNVAAVEQFKLGSKVYVDFSAAPD